MKSISEMSITDPDTAQDPYDYYERLRNEDPVHYDEKLGAWFVTRYKDSVAVARDTVLFSDEMRVSDAVRSPYQDGADDYIKSKGFYLLDPSHSFKVDGELHQRRLQAVPASVRKGVSNKLSDLR